MTKHHVHALTPIETDCGVTLEQVAHLMPKLLFIDNDSKLVFPRDTNAALASSAARCAFAGAPVEFAGLNLLSQPVYRRA